MNPDLLADGPVEYLEKRIFWISLVIGMSNKSRATLFKDLTYTEAEKKFEELNLAFGHTARDEDGELLVKPELGLPMALISYRRKSRVCRN